MSYSRWSGSAWYTFSCSGPLSGDCLAMWHATDDSLPLATFEQLDGITEDGLAALVPNAPHDEIAELLEYVQEFCADVRQRRTEST